MYRLGLFLILIFTSISGHQSANPLAKALDKFNREYPQEKIYLHFDKPYYYTNEDLWFKAYLVAGPDHLPSPYSDIIYAELIDENDQLVLRHKILVKNGFGRGDLELPGLASGNYTIRAYTHWMRNFDAAFFFQKEIAIISPIDGNSLQKELSDSLALDFYPEGGDLITGVSSRVAVKASSVEQIGADAVIRLLDDQGNLITILKTNEDGIGSTVFTPQPHQSYYATINGSLSQFELPQAKSNGYSLNVNPFHSSDFVKVRVSAPETGVHRLYAIVQTRGAVTYASQIDFSENTAIISIPKKDLMTGISQLTIFNENWQPEAERLFFHQANDLLNIDIQTDATDYVPRDSVVLSIKVTTANGKPVQGSFSLSAIDAEQIDASLNEESILTNLLLTSDLKGHINNPSRFFGKGATEQTEKLDLIMMTHGWRRFAWKDLLADQYPEINYGVEQGISIQGRLLTAENGEPLKGGSISHIGSFEGKPSIAGTQSLKDGFFIMGKLYFYENEENYLKGEVMGRRRKVREVFVEIDTTAREYPSPTVRKIPLQGQSTGVIEDHIEKSIERQEALIKFEFAEKARDLGEVVVEGTRAEDSEKFGQQYSALDFDDYLKFTQNGENALQLVNGRLPNVQMRGHGVSWQPILTYNTTIRAPNLNPLVLLDGMPITFAQLRALPAARIKKAEVYRGTKQLLEAGREAGDVMRGGVLEFTSRTDEEMLEYYKRIGSNNAKTLPGGLYKTREFFAPRYISSTPQNPLPDKRMVIHWAPMIETNTDGEASLTFFNGDLETTIRIDLQGISSDGSPGVGKTTYRVKK
ncbi:MAG: hypothetical protein HEP71_23805 [Roseivirga sp.]|nr:hypothetical protein [Roseivirga sp.]